MYQRKTAIIGLGKWGKNLLREFNKLTDIAVCVTRKTDEYAKWLNDNFSHIQHQTDVNAIFEDPTIEIVVIATPIDTHYELAKKALESGKHTFLEKPPVIDINKLNELVNLASDKNLVLFVDQIYLYHPAYQQLKKIVGQKKISRFYFSWNKFGSFNESIFWNLTYHDLYIITDLIGRIESSTVISKNGFISDIDTTIISIRTENNSIGELYYNRFSSIKDKQAVFLYDDSIIVWQNDSLYEFNNNALKEIFKSDTQPLYLMIEHFLSKIETNNIEINSTAIESLKATANFV